MNKNKIMKKSGIILSVLCALLLIATFLCVNFNAKSTVVAADTLELDDNQVVGMGTGLYKIDDAVLYDALFEIYKGINPGAEDLTSGCFKSLTQLNLSKSELSRLLGGNKTISSISGLVYFKFPNLVSLDLSDNEIIGTFSDFDFMGNLQTLNLSNNNFSGFDSEFSYKLNNINLSHNLITTANLSSIVDSSVVDLSFNKLSSFEKLTLPSNASTIKLTHNKLVEDLIETTCSLEMGFQGVTDGDSITKLNTIKFYALDGVSAIEIYKVDKNGDKTLFDTVYPNEQLTSLDISLYEIRFVESLEPKVYSTVYDDIAFSCKPVPPKLTVTGENEYAETEHIFREIVTITIEAEGEIYYSINNGQTVKGTEIVISKAGSYTITYWQNLEDTDSEYETFLVISKYVDPMSFAWIALGIIVFVIAFGLAIYYKDHLLLRKKGIKSKKGFQ